MAISVVYMTEFPSGDRKSKDTTILCSSQSLNQRCGVGLTPDPTCMKVCPKSDMPMRNLTEIYAASLNMRKPCKHLHMQT